MPKMSRFKRLVVKANKIIIKKPRVTFTAVEIAFELGVSPVYARDILKCLPSVNKNIIVIGGNAQYIGEESEQTDEESTTDDDKEAKETKNKKN